MYLIIDRFEGEFAICEQEDGNTSNISIALIPKDAQEGDVIVSENGVYEVDGIKTEERKKIINNLLI